MVDSTPINWALPTRIERLEASSLHVFCASLSASDAEIRRLYRLLSVDECERANRFHFDRDRNRYVVARGLLRRLLGHYADLPPEQLEFVYSDHDKPSLAPGLPSSAIDFNLSHSATLVLYAFARGRRLGIDVEWVYEIDDRDRLAEANFSAAERAVYDALPAHQRQRAFFDCWTRKEAFVKAVGDGLTHPLDEFDVSLAPGRPAEILSVRGASPGSGSWVLEALDPAPGYAAAIVYDGGPVKLRCRRLAPAFLDRLELDPV